MKYIFSSPYLESLKAVWQFFPELELNSQYSSIPLGIVLIILDKKQLGESPSLKEIYSYFSCSHLTVKKFIDSLIRFGYLQTLKSSTDSRVKYVLMTDKCRSLCDSLRLRPLDTELQGLSEGTCQPYPPAL